MEKLRLWKLKSCVLSHMAGNGRARYSMHNCGSRAQGPNPYIHYLHFDFQTIITPRLTASGFHMHHLLQPTPQASRYFIIHTDDTSDTKASRPCDSMTPIFLCDSHPTEQSHLRPSHLNFPNSWSDRNLLCPFIFPTHSLLFILFVTPAWDYDLGYWCPSRTGLSKLEPRGQIWPSTYFCK